MLRPLSQFGLFIVAVAWLIAPASGQTALLGDAGDGPQFELPVGHSAEEVSVVAKPTSAAGEVIATPVSAAQPIASPEPVATYDTRTGTWLPDCNSQPGGWQRELEIPPHLIDCSCDGATRAGCRIWRSFVKPTDPSVDQKCVACVKEPCLSYETVDETLRAVVHRCFETSEPFKHHGCEAGAWFEAKGTKRVRKLHPCEVKVPVRYQKPVITYRDVYYYIQCDK